MTDDELLALPKVNCVTAAKYLGMDQSVLRCGVQEGKIPVGYVGVGKGGRRTNMWVCVEALIKYKHGEIDTACLILYEKLHRENAELKERVEKIERSINHVNQQKESPSNDGRGNHGGVRTALREHKEPKQSHQ